MGLKFTEMAKGMENKQQDDFGKGLNLFTRDTMLKENEAPVAYNVWAVGKNSVAKRPGVARFCTIAGGNPIDGIGSYYAGATRKLIAMCGGTLYDVTSGSAVALSAAPLTAGNFSAGYRADFCQAGGSLFVANGKQNIRVVDSGFTVRDQTGSVIADKLIFYKSCLWAAGEPSSGNETRLYRSGSDTNIGNFTYGATANPLATSVYVSKSDGQYITGFFKHQDFLYVTKERSLWRSNVGTDTYQLITNEMIDPARGCDSHHSIDSVDNDNFMFAEQGVQATGYEPNILDQIRTNIVSLRIDPDLKSIQKSRLADVEGIYFDNHYYLSYTSGGGSVNDVIKVYDRQRLGWWEFQIAIDGVFTGASCFSEFKNASGETKLYFGSPVDGSIYYFDDTLKQDQGYAILTDYKTPKLSFGDYSQMKFFLDVELYFGKTPGNPTINVFIDGTLAATSHPYIGSSGSAGTGIEKTGVGKTGVGGGSLTVTDDGGGDFVRIPLGISGRNIQVQITDEDITGTKSWEINSMHFHFKKLSPLYQPNTQ